MKQKNALFCIALAILFTAAIFRPGYRIILDGHALPGIYEPSLTLRCSTAAIRAAEEITRTHEDIPYTLVPVLCRKHTQVDEQQLQEILLESFEGVVKLYNVSMYGIPIGTVSNLRELYLIRNKHFPAWSPQIQLTIRKTYTYPEAETPSAEVEAVFRQLSGSIESV